MLGIFEKGGIKNRHLNGIFRKMNLMGGVGRKEKRKEKKAQDLIDFITKLCGQYCYVYILKNQDLASMVGLMFLYSSSLFFLS